MTHTDFLDLSSLSTRILKNKNVDQDGTKVNWLKIKRLRLEKASPGVFFYSYNFEDELKSVKVTGRGRPATMPSVIQKLYNSQLPISKEKKRDLMKMCHSNIVPKELYSWYESIKDSANAWNNRDSSSEAENNAWLTILFLSWLGTQNENKRCLK